MAKQKGHRANKPNDSFGAINDGSLYRGKYREEVYIDDEDESTADNDPSEQKDTAVEATQQSGEETSFAKPAEGSDTDYKKRYDDLKKHYDSKLAEWKKEREDLASARQVGEQSGVDASELPETVEELEEFKRKYPDVYRVVERISGMQAEKNVRELKEEVETLRSREEKLKIQGAYKELLNAHPDFRELKQDENFLRWLDQQPESIADGIYKNNTDSKWAIRVVDLYKADTGVGKKTRKSKDADPAAIVSKTSAKDISEGSADKKVWKASEIGKLKPWEFEKIEKEIDSARAEGRIDYRA
jgi:hypothetical protein